MFYMANSDYTYDGIMSSGTGYFQPDTTKSYSVVRMQTKLKRLGFLSGTADGIFGSQTTTALQNFQASQNITVNGLGNQVTLVRLNSLSPDTTTELYGRELTHTEWTEGYNNTNISNTEALARTIYGEDSLYSDGQSAVAKELWNRMKSTRNFCELSQTWKGYLYGSSQYAVVTSSNTNDTRDARRPDQYSTQWAYCVTLAQMLVSGLTPSSSLLNQCYHLSAGSIYPSASLASTRVQIPTSLGNKFFDYQTAL
jgi:peptidoglycan hydrolase-like protein with peptidoglycan-binding domain